MASMRRALTVAGLGVGVFWFLVVVLWSDAVFSMTFDDAWYYWNIADHLAAGDGSTFDGVNLTNGYHPLWLAISVPVYLAGGEGMGAGRTLLAFQMLVYGVSLAVLGRAVAAHTGRWRRYANLPEERSTALRSKGTLVVAVVQGLLGGITFGLLGIEASVLWGVTMGLLSLLPAVGPPLVWIPASIILIVTGSFWKGVILILVGTFVIGLVDNFLRPILVGRDTRIPDYLVLIATLGGITVFGIAGVIAGPLVAGLFLVVWDIFAEEHANRSSGSLLRDYAGREIRSVRIESGEPAAMVDEPAQAENPTNDPARED